MRILVSAVGGDLGQSVIKCLRVSGYDPYVMGCDMNPYAGGRADVDEFFQAPPVKKEEKYRDFLLQTIEEKKINYVFLLSDVEISFLNSRRQLFSQNKAVFVLGDKHIIDTFMDKYKTVEFLKTRGMPFPETYLPSQYKNQLSFPLILKRRRGSGGQDLFKVKDPGELEFYLGRYNDMIIQEYLPGKDNEYTAGLFSDGKTDYTITFRRTLAPGGFSQHVELVSDAKITEFPVKIAAALDFKGSLNVQFRQTEKGCIPFEINPRFSSTVFLRHTFGFKDVMWSLDLWEGKSVFYSPCYKRGVAVRKFSETFFDMEKV